MKLNAFGISDVGLQRSTNEDSFFVDEQQGLFIVADGMGGHAAGEVASDMLVKMLSEQVAADFKTLRSAEQWQQLLATAVGQANLAIRDAGSNNQAWNGMGTTLTLLLLRGQTALLTHVGDSRLYRWRAGQLEQLSEDQTLVADQLRRGILTHEEADKSNLRNILLQAVGTTEELEIHQKAFPLLEDDSFLLCSDGLNGMLSDQQISRILSKNKRPEPACQQLIEAALAAGGKDNVTAVLLTTSSK